MSRESSEFETRLDYFFLSSRASLKQMDPILLLTYNVEQIVGAFVFPGQIASNPDGPFAALGVLSINSDWVTTNGQSWTITIVNGDKQVILYPSQFAIAGDMLNAWVAYDPLVLDWSTSVITAVRGNAAVTLSIGTTGVGGTLSGVDLTSANYTTISKIMLGAQGPAPAKKKSTFHTVVTAIGVLILLYILYRVYKLVRG